MSKEYGNNSIKTLTDWEAVRLRPANILGSDDINGAIHVLREILGNALDEAKGSFGDTIIVTKYEDASVSVEDFGRGVPMQYNEAENEYNYNLVFSRLHSGGKYSKDEDDAYADAIGLSGLGAAASHLSSEYFYVRSRRDGHCYEIDSKDGEFVGELKERKEDYQSTGTFIKWKSSLDVFTEIDIPIDVIKTICKEQAIVNKGIKLIVINESTNERFEYFYENGIIDYMNENIAETSFTDIQYWETKARGRDHENRKEYSSKYQIAFCFSNEKPMMKSYHNSSYLKNGGSPHDAIKSAFTYSIDKLIKQKNKYDKKEKKITWDSIEDSLCIISNTYSTETSYENQTKFAITNKFIKDYMNQYLREQLEIYFIENPLEADKIINQVLINKRAAEKAQKTRVAAVKQLSQEIKNSITRPEKFLPCRSNDKNEVELIFIEGDSAMNSVKNSRNSKIQCVYPLKGKSLNVIKANLESILNNKEIRDVFQILNCGMEYNGKAVKGIKKFNIDDLSVNKIIIFSDEDEDGMHVRSLIIAVLKILAPKIIENGHLYVLESPLYKIENGKEVHLVYNEKEKNELVRTLTGKVSVQRFKGLGGLNSSMLSKTAMHPENRRLTQITMEDAEKSTRVMEMFMDKAVEDRKAYIQEHGDKYFDFSIYE